MAVVDRTVDGHSHVSIAEAHATQTSLTWAMKVFPMLEFEDPFLRDNMRRVI